LCDPAVAASRREAFRQAAIERAIKHLENQSQFSVPYDWRTMPAVDENGCPLSAEDLSKAYGHLVNNMDRLIQMGFFRPAALSPPPPNLPLDIHSPEFLDSQTSFKKDKLATIEEGPEDEWREFSRNKKRRYRARKQTMRRSERHRKAFPIPWLQQNRTARTDVQIKTHFKGRIQPATRDATIIGDCLCHLWCWRYVDNTMPEADYAPLFEFVDDTMPRTDYVPLFAEEPKAYKKVEYDTSMSHVTIRPLFAPKYVAGPRHGKKGGMKKILTYEGFDQNDDLLRERICRKIFLLRNVCARLSKEERLDQQAVFSIFRRKKNQVTAPKVTKKGVKLPPSPPAPKQKRATNRQAEKKRTKSLGILSGIRQAKEAYDKFEEAKHTIAYPGSDPDNIMGNLMARAEDILTLVLGLTNAQNMASFFVAIQGYLRSLYQESISAKVFTWISDALQEKSTFVLPSVEDLMEEIPLSHQSVFDSLRSINIAEGINGLRDVINNWRSHKSNPLAKNLANVMNILVTLGFCPHLKENPVKLGCFELFRAKAWDTQKDSWDFADMAINTLDFFLERGHHALITGDISLLLSGDASETAYEKEYSILMSCLPALEAQRLDDLSKYGVDIKHEGDFDFRLQALIRKTVQMIASEKAPPRKKVLSDYLINLRKLAVQLVISQKSSSLREKPFGLLVYGRSSVGKSAVVNCLMKSLLAANGFANKKDNVVTINDNEDFDTVQEPFHTGWIYDDYGNTRAEHYSDAPTRTIIDVLNNIPRALRKPDLESKGNKMMNPKIVGITTNIKNLHAPKFSVEPVSILRRFEVVLDVKVRPEYTKANGSIDGSKMDSWLPDAWMIDVQRVMIDRKPQSETKDTHKPDGYHFETIMADASIADVLRYCKELSAEHFASQKRFVRNVESMYEREFCSCGFPLDECQQCSRYGKPDVSHSAECPIKEALKISHQSDFVNDSDDEQWYDAADGDDILDVVAMEPSTIKEAIQRYNRVLEVASTLGGLPCAAKNLAEAIEEHKDTILKVTLGTFGITAGAYAAFRLVKDARTLTMPLTSQSSEAKAPEVLPTDQPNPWKKVHPTAIPKSAHSSNITFDDLLRKVRQSLAFAKIYAVKENGERVVAPCNALPLTGNEWVFPRHVLNVYDEVEIHLTKVPDDQVGFRAIQKINKNNWVDIGNDLALVRVKAGGSQPELHKFLPDGDWDLTSQLACGYSSFNDELEMTKDLVKVMEKKVFQTNISFMGFSYKSPTATFVGQCGSPLVTYQRRPCLLGFHIAGRTGTDFAVASCITRQDFERAHSELMSKDPLACHSEGTFITSKFGIDFTPTNAIPEKHAINYLEDDEDGQKPACVTYGAHPQGTVKFISQVKKSPVSDTVADIMDIPRVHGAPQKGRTWRHWQRDLRQMAHPKGGTMRPAILDKAFDDLLTKFRTYVKESGKQSLIHPYPNEVVLSGMDGISSVDKVDLVTSMGWPLNKSKKWFLEESEKKYPGITQLIQFMEDSPLQWEDIEQMENELAEGRRIHVVFRGNLKDEPTKFTKDKIRVFAGCEFGFTCLVRKYFLSLVRLIQDSEGKLECSVGVNATSPQWTKMAKVLTRFGTERMIAGDYKAYDKNISIQMMQYAFEILIQLAEDAGYDERQLTIMRGIATEISQPLYEYNGIFIQMFGSNPSGHPLTVIINNIVNSLYLRYAYYSMHEGEDVPLFDEVVALLCYGDDNAAGVSEEEEKFNHTSLSEELAKIGITYTMADKEAESVPFIPFSEVTFLKRHFRWCEESQNFKAPIEEASVAKSLHNYMKRKGSDTLPEEISAQVIRGANFEFFHHGREVFERRREQLHQVADTCGIRKLVGDLDTYDDLQSRYLDAGWKRDILDEPDVPMLLSFDGFLSRED
jgi:hypothetical protein